MAVETAAATVRPTKKQQQLLAFIEQFIGEHGYSPSYREIMNGCQYTSVATVALHVGNLIKRGHLRKRDHSARSIEVVKDRSEAGASETDAAVLAEPIEWLQAKLETLVSAAESRQVAGGLDGRTLDDIQTVLAAYDVLGLAAMSAPFIERYQLLLGSSRDA